MTDKEQIINKIRQCKTMKELDALRLEVTKAMFANNNEHFYCIQKVFKRQKNKLLHIPLRDRI